MTLALLPVPLFKATDANGLPLALGKLYSYAANSSTPQALLAADGTTSLTNPVILDASGQAEIRLGPNAYKLNLLSALDVQQTGWPIDNVSSLAPTTLGDYSATAAQMRLQTDPGEVGTESLATSLSGELERLRYAIYDAKHADDPNLTYWYETPYGSGALNAKSYGAVGDGTTDDTAALQAWLTAIHTAGGGVGLLPAGTYLTTAALIIYANTTLQGAGRNLSLLKPNHTGDGLQSTNTVNTGGTAVNLCLRDFGIYNSVSYATNTGGGFVDVAGAYISLHNVYIQGFKYQVILDQSSHVDIHQCAFGVAATTCGIWLVNGPDHTGGANTGYTNLITITGNQFNSNSTGTHIINDGGANHLIQQNNFNAAAVAIRAANTSNLTIADNFFEGNAGYDVYLIDTTLLGGVHQYLNYNPVITRNSFSTNTVAAYHLYVDNAAGGEITRNVFVGHAAQSAMFTLGTNVAHLVIEGNMKSPPPAIDKPFLAANAPKMSAQYYRQRLQTSHALAAAAGARTLDPRDMGFLTSPERPRVFERLLVINLDGTNGEFAPITAVSATQLSVTLATDKAANFLIFAAGLSDSLNNNTAGVVSGTGTILSGTTNVTITHGLGYTPLAQDLNLTQTAATTATAGGIWISLIGATTFQVNCDNNPGASGLVFAWRALPAHYRY